MVITLSNDELTAAVKQYLGDEYDVEHITFVVSRKGGTSTKAEVTATRYTGTRPPVDVGIEEDNVEEIEETTSLFPQTSSSPSDGSAGHRR